MTHLVNTLFFVMVLVGSMEVLWLTARQYWNEILSALGGEMPVRHAQRAWARPVRVTVRPRPQVARATQQRAAA